MICCWFYASNVSAINISLKTFDDYQHIFEKCKASLRFQHFFCPATLPDTTFFLFISIIKPRTLGSCRGYGQAQHRQSSCKHQSSLNAFWCYRFQCWNLFLAHSLVSRQLLNIIQRQFTTRQLKALSKKSYFNTILQRFQSVVKVFYVRNLSRCRSFLQSTSRTFILPTPTVMVLHRAIFPLPFR